MVVLVLMAALGAVGLTVLLATGSVIAALNTLSVAFVGVMAIRVLVAVVRLPWPRRYGLPDRVLVVPDRIDRQHLPTWREPWGEVALADLVDAVIHKIRVAADESAIQTFVGARFDTLRRQVADRYASCSAQIETLGFEGVMGTILGLMVFLAQAAALFDLPLTDGSLDSGQLVSAIASNVDAINLGTVMTAFVTSLIGWGARAWLGGILAERQRRELVSLTAVEAWVQDQILARLYLPAQVQTVLELQEIEALTRPIAEALARIDLREVTFDVRYVEGGVRVVGRQAELS
ncbi:MAG: hypothetical protein R3F59_32630 [Myxococcota bacterium]